MTLIEAVVSTLAYSDQFSYPLTVEELHHRLISYRLTLSSLKNKLRHLESSGEIVLTKGHYHLPGRSNLVALRARRAALARPLIKRAHILAKGLSRIPGVFAIYLTGSLAVKSANSNSDIDFMIITKSGALWTTRALITLSTTLLGLRRTPGSSTSYRKLCLNLYLTPASLAIPKSKRTLYSAYELIQAVPIYDPRSTHSALLLSNSWLSNYLPNYPLPSSTKFRSLQTKQPPTLNFIENLAYRLQLTYMRPRLTREFITKDSAFFHPRLPRELK